MTARLANLADFKCEGMREQMKVPSASAAQFTDRQPVTQQWQSIIIMGQCNLVFTECETDWMWSINV